MPKNRTGEPDNVVTRTIKSLEKRSIYADFKTFCFIC